MSSDQTARPITPFDLLELPQDQRRIMRMVLRQRKVTEGALQKANADLPDAERLTESALAAAIAALVERGWLLRNAEGQQTPDQSTYQVGSIVRKGGFSVPSAESSHGHASSAPAETLPGSKADSVADSAPDFRPSGIADRRRTGAHRISDFLNAPDVKRQPPQKHETRDDPPTQTTSGVTSDESQK